MPGRKRTPPALKLVKGNPGKRKVEEPAAPPPGEVVCPDHLEDRAREIWDEKAPILIGLGILNVLGIEKFAMWCNLAALFENGPLTYNAALISQWRGLGSTFGMEATSYQRLNGGSNKPKADPADDYFKAG